MKYQVIVGNVGNVYSGDSYKEAMSCFCEYKEQSQSNYGRASGEEVTLFEDGEIVKEYIPEIKTPSIKELQKELTSLKSCIEDEFIDAEDDKPSIQITLGADQSGYALQTGDNSFSGPAYSYRYWGVGSLYRDSNCRDLAKDLIDQCMDLAAQ